MRRCSVWAFGFSLFACVSLVPAQLCLAQRGTGCQGVTVPKCGGNHKIGGSLVTSFACPTPSFGFYLFGACTQAFAIVPPTVCAPAACTLAVNPIGSFFVMGSNVTLPIPMDPSLVGRYVCFAGLCVDLTLACVTLTPTAAFQILP
jgi:hypothetical protein